jgi:hypothetical protein
MIKSVLKERDSVIVNEKIDQIRNQPSEVQSPTKKGPITSKEIDEFFSNENLSQEETNKTKALNKLEKMNRISSPERRQ